MIGGQLFSKSLRGVMGYKMEFAGLEGWFMGAVLLLPAVRYSDRVGEAVPVGAAADERRYAAPRRWAAVASPSARLTQSKRWH